jgi:hypothetical protein
MDNLNLSKYAMKQFKKENDLTDIQIDFGGFYHSYHSDIIDRDIEQFIESLLDEDKIDEDKIDDIYNNIDYNNIHNQYIKKYCSFLEQIIHDEFNIKIDFVNISLNSPREYNFSTDVILCEADKYKLQDLTDKFLNHSDWSEYKDLFLDYVTEITTFRSGYIPHYTYDEIMNNKNTMLFTQIFNFLINTQFIDEMLTDIEFYASEYVNYENGDIA